MTEESSIINKYNLSIGEIVQFRKKEGAKWIKGKVLGENADGSIVLLAQGRARSILPIYIQAEREKGKRGKQRWVDIVENEL